MSYKKRYSLFFLAVIIFNLTANFAHPVTPTVIKELNLHDYMFGVAYAAMMLTNFLFSPFWGKVNAYVSSRTSLLICCAGYGAAQVIFGLARTEAMIILARMLGGMFVGGIFVSFMTYIVNTAEAKDQGRFLTYNVAIKSVAGAFGYMIGGFLGEISIKLVFFAQAACLVAVAAAFFLICVPDVKEGGVKGLPVRQVAKEANPFQAFIDSRDFMDTAFALLFAINVLTNFSYTAFDQAFNYYLKDALGLSSSYNGIVKAAVGLLTFAANMTICVWIISKTDVKRSLAAVIAACALSALGMALSERVALFITCSMIAYAGYSISVPVLQSMVVRLAKPEQKNLVVGFFNATQSLGSVAGSLTAGFIYPLSEKLPFAVTFVVYALGLAAAIAYLCRRPGTS